MGDQERALGYADICDRPYLHENFHATALLYRQIRFGSLPECFIALSFPFSLFYIIFSATRPFPDKGNSKIRISLSPPCRRIFTVFFFFSPNESLHLKGNNRGFPNVLRAFKKRAQAAFYHFAATPPIFSSFRFLSDLATVLTVPYALTAFFASEKCANACGAR